MCDLRRPPKVKNLLTGETTECYRGAIGVDFYKAKEPGIYHIGASGCGYSYYDGKDWISCYYPKPNPNYEFIFDPKIYKEDLWFGAEPIKWDEETKTYKVIP